jgi:hypothetical protein
MVVLKIGRNTLSETRERRERTLKELQQIALGLGVRFKGLTKAELASAIAAHQEEAPDETLDPGWKRKGKGDDDLSG